MVLLFDLDGTLTDSREGIVRCMQYGLAQLGAAVPPADQLRQYVGPPLAGTFATLLGTSDESRIEAAIAAYRQRFEPIGMFENAVYPGIREALTELAAAGHHLCVVTAKPHVYARQILEHFDLAKLFGAVYGPELGLRGFSKESLIREACASENIVPARTVMIGDRADDIIGAKRNGLCAIGVTWGFGDRAELEAASPDYLVASSEELVQCIRDGVWPAPAALE
jgi:phosphoglycolate phosphatase